jgi:hypothetical protein
MRDLTSEEATRRDERLEQFQAFQGEITDVLIDLAEGIQLPEQRALIDDPGAYLPAIDEWVAGHPIDHRVRGKLLARLGCLAGQLLTARLDGRWFMDETPDSPHFLHFVVGDFVQIGNRALIADPFAIAAAYLDRMEVKDFGSLIEAVVSELQSVSPEAEA